jgi:acylphosphatase
MLHYKIQIWGSVQGIGFRWATHRKAASLKLTGYVQNQPDGSVLIEAEGDEQSLDKLVSWCHRGPLFAKVSEVKVEKNSSIGYNEFEIKD